MGCLLVGGEGDSVVQFDNPNWEPLLDAVGEHLTGTFMWMHEARLDDGTPLHAYKHIWTRQYLYLSLDRRGFQLAACGRFVPLRLDFAIEHALCGWWVLEGWEEADVEAIRDAVLRGQPSAQEP